MQNKPKKVSERFIRKALSEDSTRTLNERDRKTKASEKVEVSRGTEEREEIIDFLLIEPLTCCILGAGYKGGQPIAGVEQGPAAIREQNLAQDIKDLGWEVKDEGDLKFETIENDTPSPEGVKFPRTVGRACQQVFEKSLRNASQGKLNLTIGGDHSLAMGSVAASCRAWEDTVVIWVDAHGDINTPASSLSGNLHGMPVAFLLGLADHTTIPGFEWFSPCLDAERIVFIGLRDVDLKEKKILRDQKITAYSMTEVDKYGIGKIMEMALDKLNPKRDKPIHLSFDIDAIDPLVCPSTGTKVRGGLSYREACYICEAIAETGRLVALDLVEMNPAIGSAKDVADTASVAVGLAKSALGQRLIYSAEEQNQVTN